MPFCFFVNRNGGDLLLVSFLDLVRLLVFAARISNLTCVIYSGNKFRALHAFTCSRGAHVSFSFRILFTGRAVPFLFFNSGDSLFAFDAFTLNFLYHDNAI